MTVHNMESFTWADWPGHPKHPGVRTNLQPWPPT